MPILLSILAGWNIFIISWFAIAIALAACGLTGFFMLGISIVLAVTIACFSAYRILPYFVSKTTKIQIILFIFLLLLCFVFFPQQYVFVASAKIP